MCLTIPKQVISVKKRVAIVKTHDGFCDLGSLVSVKKGDWVLSQNNLIIRKISKKNAEEINRIINSAKKL